MKIGELASIVRSKNAGPFQLTLDIFFKDRKTYEKVKKTNAINTQKISELYGILEEDVRIYEIDRVKAIKISIRRLIPSGDIFDTDIYGAQQHAPLLGIEISEE